jgi:hypothetical protein
MWIYYLGWQTEEIRFPRHKVHPGTITETHAVEVGKYQVKRLYRAGGWGRLIIWMQKAGGLDMWAWIGLRWLIMG